MGKQNILRMLMVQTVLLLVMTSAAATEAKEGFYLGARMVFADIRGNTYSKDTISSGDGAGLTMGYGINRNIAVDASFWSTDHSRSDGMKLDLDAALLYVKATLPLAESHIEPYLMLGIGKYTFDAERGDGRQYGAGMDILLSQAFTLTIGITRHVVELGSAPRESVEVTSMDIGLTYCFN